MTKIKKIALFFIAILAMSFVVIHTAQCDHNQPVSYADSVTKKIEQAYKSVERYYDKGEIKTETGIFLFDTFFVKNEIFQIRWIGYDALRSKISKNMIFSNQNGTFAYADRFKKKDPRKYDNLKDALVKMLRYSHGLIGNIPAQLYQNSGIKPLTSLNDFQVLGEDVIRREACIHLKALHQITDKDVVEYHIWSSKKTYNIQKVEQHYKGNKIIYDYEEIRINDDLAIPAKDLLIKGHEKE